MGDPPDGLTLGRVNNDGMYEPTNCRWESLREQARNRRSTYLISAFGRVKCVADWAEEYGIKADTLRWRVKKRGLPAEKALLTPVSYRRLE
jgi:hypothetical protein